MARLTAPTVFSTGKQALAALAGASLLLLGGCAVELENRQAAQEVARESQPPGSVYTGWRVYQDKCASCHGPAGTGSGNAPDLLAKLRETGSRRFIGLVLYRYDWTRPAMQPGTGKAPSETEVESVMQRKAQALVMPAWGTEPRVNAHIMDLYAYLSARSEGNQGPGRPAP